VKTFFL